MIPSRPRAFFIIVIVAAATLAFAACSSDDDAAADPTPGATKAATVAAQSTTRAATRPAAAASAPAATPSSATPSAAGATSAPVATAIPRTPGALFSLSEAQALIEASHLKATDIKDLNNTWKIQTDNPQDNDAFAAASPEQAPLVEQCGRVFGRTVVLIAEDVIGAFIGGETLSFFSQMTVYGDDAGADVCAADAAQRLAVPGALARQFGTVFIDPAAVVVTPVEYPATGDGSFAATLTGQSNAQGQIVDLTILVVGFQTGNVSAAVGSVRSGSAPPQDELKAYVDLVLQRIQANQ